MPTDDEITVDRAYGIIQRAYYDDVKGLASSIKEYYDRGEISDREHLIERIDETVDGCARVIYTRSAQEALFISRNDNAGIEALGADGFDWKDGIPWSGLAYFAVHADVIEALEEMGLDVNADFEVCDDHHKPIPEGEECEVCAEAEVEE